MQIHLVSVLCMILEVKLIFKFKSTLYRHFEVSHVLGIMTDKSGVIENWGEAGYLKIEFFLLEF